jgi:hypothetical protein
MNRRRYDEIKKRDQIIARAVELARASGFGSVGTSSGPASITTAGAVGGVTTPDADGNTLYTFLTEVDETELMRGLTVASTPV